MIATLLMGTWITVMNPGGIANGNYHFPFGEVCFLSHFLAIETVHSGDEDTLFRVGHGLEATGTACPNGTLFLMKPTALQEKQTEETFRVFQRLQQEQSIRERLKQQP